MGEFRKPGGFGGGRDKRRDGGGRGGFGGGRPSFGGPREDKQMFTATCGECGKQCEVPFRPTGERPVYCRECFAGKRDERPSFGDRDSGPRDFPKRDFSPAPAPHAGGSDKRIEELKRQMDGMNIKLDMLIQLVKGETPAAVKKPEVKPETFSLAPAPKKELTAPSKEKKAGKVEKKPVAKKKPAKK